MELDSLICNGLIIKSRYYDFNDNTSIVNIIIIIIIIGPKCQELGWSCIPLAVETYGNWGKLAHDTFSRLASFLAIHQSSPKALVVAEIYGRLNVVLVRSIARAILARELPPS